MVNRLRPLLEEAADPQLKTYLKEIKQRQRKISSWEELQQFYPEISAIIIDATETPTVRPVKPRKQKQHYSGKKKRHTLKNQVTVSKKGQILHIGKSVPGKKHDYQLFKEENILKYLPPDVKAYLDLGHDGVKKDFPEYFQIQQGVKKRRNKLTLTRSEKMANKRIAKQRIVIEHIFSCIKKYQVLATKYRHDFKSHNQDFRNIAALVNFRHGFSTTS